MPEPRHLCGWGLYAWVGPRAPRKVVKWATAIQAVGTDKRFRSRDVPNGYRPQGAAGSQGFADVVDQIQEKAETS